jgi:DNA-binding PadR family transcriptional regulator
MNPEIEDATTQSWLKEAQKGYIRMGVLILLNKKPSHGYEIMKEINSRTRGIWKPTAGGVYPILRDLEKCGYITGQWQTQRNRRLKVYKITKQGEDILKKAIVKQAEIFNNISSLFTEFSRDVLNIEVKKVPIPPVPTPFCPFLEDKARQETFEQLQRQRKHFLENIKILKSSLKEVDAKIAKAKKDAKPPVAEGEPQPQ